MAKSLKRQKAKLKQRQASYDAVKNLKLKKAMKRPGSMNKHKQA